MDAESGKRAKLPNRDKKVKINRIFHINIIELGKRASGMTLYQDIIIGHILRLTVTMTQACKVDDYDVGTGASDRFNLIQARCVTGINGTCLLIRQRIDATTP